MKQAELAKRVGVSRPTLAAIEKVNSNPSVDVALRLAKELDARVEDLFVLEVPPLSREPISRESRKEILALKESQDLAEARWRREGLSEAQIENLIQFAPLRLPVPPEDASEFLSILFRYTKGSNRMLWMLYEILGADDMAHFISRFRGSSVWVEPSPYWENRFRDIHIYFALRTISDVNDPRVWRRRLNWLASEYDMTTGSVIRTFESVKKVAQNEGT